MVVVREDPKKQRRDKVELMLMGVKLGEGENYGRI
jgi:hypothetical protein